MKKALIVSVVALAAVGMACVPEPPPGGGGTTTTTTTTTAPPTFQQEAVNSINAARADAGLGPVTLCTRLTNSAQAHSEDMEASGVLSFTGSDGSTFIQRINAAGYFGSPLGELIARGFTSSASVVQAWLNDPTTSPRVLDPAYEHVGVGLSATDNYWTTDWGAGGVCDPA